MSTDHLPPQDIDAERAVIGAILISADALDSVAEVINPGDFYQPKHEAVFRAALTVQGRRDAVDALTVGAELERTGDSSRVGGTAYLFECVNEVPVAANGVHYAEIVVEKAKRRLIDAAARRIMSAVQEGAADADDILARAEEEIGNISATRNRVQARPLSETLERTLEMLDAGEESFTPTPWVDLNDHIYGWRPGAVHIVGARPGGGKSLMGLQTAIGMARTGKAVTYAVMEMDTNELNVRLLAQTANVGMDSLSKRRLTDMEWQKISARVPELTGLPLFVDDTPRQTMAHIRAHARHVARRADLGMVVVDYIQQVVTPDHLAGRPRHEQVAHTTSHIKALARELHVPVVAMAQVRRAPMGSDRPPTMDDLRESGSIEADADDVMLLHRPDPSDHEVSCYVRKARSGRLGDFKLVWEGHFARMRSHADPYGKKQSA